MQTRKITAYLPVDLLHKAQVATNKSIADTLKIALIQLVRVQAYDALRKIRGKVEFSLNITELRS